MVKKLANKKKFYELRFPVVAQYMLIWKLGFFPAQSIEFSVFFFIWEKVFSVFLFADNLLLYLGRWDVDVAIGKEIEGKKEKEKS